MKKLLISFFIVLGISSVCVAEVTEKEWNYRLERTRFMSDSILKIKQIRSSSMDPMTDREADQILGFVLDSNPYKYESWSSVTLREENLDRLIAQKPELLLDLDSLFEIQNGRNRLWHFSLSLEDLDKHVRMIEVANFAILELFELEPKEIRAVVDAIPIRERREFKNYMQYPGFRMIVGDKISKLYK